VAGAERARGLTQQLITFAKGGDPQKRIMKIDELVRDTVNFVLSGANVVPYLKVDDDIWMCNIDPGQIEQVLANFVVNARQAMPDGGKVSVTVRNVPAAEAEARGFDSRDYVEIDVHDDGEGINPEVISKIFDPYFTTKKDGLGLGLAISYSIINRHNGHISVESEPGCGATFRVLLPAVKQRVAAQVNPSADAKLTKSHKVLLMEDEPMVGEVIITMLELLNCRASHALDGETAIELYKQAQADGDPYDVVILDIIVPNGMGGKETSEHLLRIDSSARLIISSAYSNNPLMAEYAANGFAGCIAKPYSKKELEAVLKMVLESGGGVSGAA
jgi:CheY-like chemotaxis protein